jgi:hypothetical protein
MSSLRLSARSNAEALKKASTSTVLLLLIFLLGLHGHHRVKVGNLTVLAPLESSSIL